MFEEFKAMLSRLGDLLKRICAWVVEFVRRRQMVLLVAVSALIIAVLLYAIVAYIAKDSTQHAAKRVDIAVPVLPPPAPEVTMPTSLPPVPIPAPAVAPPPAPEPAPIVVPQEASPKLTEQVPPEAKPEPPAARGFDRPLAKDWLAKVEAAKKAPVPAVQKAALPPPTMTATPPPQPPSVAAPPPAPEPVSAPPVPAPKPPVVRHPARPVQSPPTFEELFRQWFMEVFYGRPA